MTLATGLNSEPAVRSGKDSEAAMEPAIGGFTLIEVLVALVILSTGIVLVLRAFETALAASERSRDSMIATMLVREKLNQVESTLLIDRVVDSGGTEAFDEGEAAGFRRTCAVAPAAGQGASLTPAQGALYEIRVAVARVTSGTELVAATHVFVPPPSEKSAGIKP